MNFQSALAVLCLGLSIGCARQPPAQAKPDAGPVEIRVASVSTRQIQRIVESVGTLFPYDEVIVSAEIEGRVDKVNVDLGDRVEAGQVMVQVSDEEQRYLLAQNEAQLQQSLGRLGLKSAEDKVRDIRETPEVRRAQADLLESEQRYKRIRSLVDQKIGAQADLDQSMARFQASQAAYDATLNQTRNLIQEVERSKAVVELQRKKLRDTTVRAPFSGYIKERQVTAGQYVRPNAALLTLVKTDPIRLRLEIPERLAPWIRNGQLADVSVEAFAGRIFQGKVWRIAPTVDQSKRTFVVEALIENQSGDLKPGSYAKARLATGKTEQIRLIPVLGINYVLGSNKGYVVKDGVVETRELQIGDRFGQDVEVLAGLEAGETVAVSQLARLDTGVKVRVATAPKSVAREAKPAS